MFQSKNSKFIKSEEKEKVTFDINQIPKEWKYHAVVIAYITYFCITIYLYMNAVYHAKEYILTTNVPVLCLAFILPIFAFLVATKTEFWNYHNRKVMLYKSVIVSCVLTAMQPLYTICRNTVIPLILKIPVTPAMTQDMIVFLAQYTLFLCICAIVAILYSLAGAALLSEQMLENVKVFKITHHVDDRENISSLYDLTITNDLETGKKIIFKMEDRLLHLFVNGKSGTGKTSSVFLPAVAQDLATKWSNFKKRISGLINLLLKRKAYIDTSTGILNEHSVHPVKGYEAEYEELYSKYRDCGMAIVAPDNSTIEKVIKLGASKHQQVGVIDPTGTYYKYKNYKKLGFNPFFIRKGTTGKELQKIISFNARMFILILIAINERSGRSDVYFNNIMKSIGNHVSKVVMLARNIEGKQTNIIEIQQCIINPSNLAPLIKTIENYFGIEVEVTRTKKQKNGGQAQESDLDKNNVNVRASLTKKEKAKENPYYQDILFVKEELLGDYSEEMYNQGRGLRNIINLFLEDPDVKEIFMANEDEMLDFDKMLANGDIVVVNTAIELGDDASTALGLFFLLYFKIAVYRRPKPYDNLPLFWLYVDESSQYLHRQLEDFITVFRKYQVGCTFAVQGMTQFEKNDETRYLGGVFMGSGTQYVFGRLDNNEMKTYSELVGKMYKEVEQKTTSQTSIFAENASRTTSTRTTPDTEDRLSGTKIRQLDFQEITVLTVDKGRVLEGKLGKVHFVKNKDYKKVKAFDVDWEELAANVMTHEGVVDGAEQSSEKTFIDMELPEEEQFFATDAFLSASKTAEIPEWMELPEEAETPVKYVEATAEEIGKSYGEKTIASHEKERIGTFNDYKEEKTAEKTVASPESPAVLWYDLFGEE